jgi:hypothetical protein
MPSTAPHIQRVKWMILEHIDLELVALGSGTSVEPSEHKASKLIRYLEPGVEASLEWPASTGYWMAWNPSPA